MKRIFVKTHIFLLFFLIFIFPQKAQAIVKFNTDFQSFYRVNSNGITHVSFVINQKNNLSVVYATDFGININETKVSNVKVSDEGITIIPEIVKTLNQTTISFPFANKVVGKDKNHQFIIDYETTDIATKFGNTWQINIPRLETNENITSRTVVLTVPEDFPTAAYIDPTPDSINKNVYYFSGAKLGSKPISAVFGQTQYYKGQIRYHLINESKTKIASEIAIPPDTAYQTIYIENIEPKPISINSDEDGNLLAKYILEPNTKIDVNLTLYIKLSFTPKQSNELPNDKYLLPNSIWNFDNSVFTSPEIKNLTSAKSIYDFVVDKFQYDYQKVNRQKSQKTPAAESLMNNQSAICTDFANVFVSLSRKAGIHSRELQGYAISDNPDLKPLSLTQDVLHAWPEYFDKKTNTWTQIDPTWSNTTRGIDYFNKLDFNHIVFVIHGIDPDYPIPAGGYKYKQEKTKDIEITPVDTIVFPEPKLFISSFSQQGKNIALEFQNDTGVSFFGQAKTENGSYIKEYEQNIKILPFGKTAINVKLLKLPFIKQSTTKVIIYINGIRFEQSITVQPTVPKAAFFAIIGIILAIITLITRSIYLRRQKQKTSLYR